MNVRPRFAKASWGLCIMLVPHFIKIPSREYLNEQIILNSPVVSSAVYYMDPVNRRTKDPAACVLSGFAGVLRGEFIISLPGELFGK